MEDKLRAHMDHLFRDVPPTKQATEIKEEILQNITDKYHDLLAEGKTEEAAYNIAVASIGDLSDLLQSLKENKTAQNAEPSAEYQEWKKKSAIRVTISVMLYILSIVPAIVMDMLNMGDIGALGMFVIIAAATGLLVYNNMTKPAHNKADDTIAEEFKEWQENNDTNKQTWKAINGALWSIIVALYFIISFSTGAWYVTWVIFLIGGAVESILKLLFTNSTKGGNASTAQIVQILAKIVLIVCIITIVVVVVVKGSLFNFKLGTIHFGNGNIYDNADKYSVGNGSVEADTLDTLNIDWIDGSVQVLLYDGATIEISEEGSDSLEEKKRVHYYYNNGKLDIQYQKSGSIFQFGKTGYNKKLTVRIPRALAENIQSFDGTFVSTAVTLTQITAKDVNIDIVSGDVSLSGSYEDLEMDSVSGNLEITSAITPKNVECDSVSGDVKLYIPTASEFRAEMDSVSGDIDCDLSYDSKDEGVIKKGDDSNSYEFDSVSGDVTIGSSGVEQTPTPKI